jgi:formyltetrahydrofolate-dependent phosphoribosylglycinamide formyltransferase
VPYRVAVAASGRGSNLAALVRRFEPGGPAEVVLVLSNRPDAGALAIARAEGIPTAVLGDPSDAGAWMASLAVHRVDLLVLAGYLKLVPTPVVQAYQGRMINLHPALLPRHGGAGMYGLRVHAAVLAAGERESGATVHLVTEEYDRGPILAQVRVPVHPDDTPERLAARIQAVEHRLLPEVVLAAARAGRPVPVTLPPEAVP